MLFSINAQTDSKNRQQQHRPMTSDVNQRSKVTRKENTGANESESKKREDLTSLGSDDSGEHIHGLFDNKFFIDICQF